MHISVVFVNRILRWAFQNRLRDCSKSVEVWKYAIPQSKYNSFFPTQFHHWIKNNCDDTFKIGMVLNNNWTLMFVAITRHIWKARNDEVFKQLTFSPYKVQRLASIFSTDMQVSHKQFTSFNLDPVNGRWIKPPPGYMMLNVDGGFRNRQGTYEGVLRGKKMGIGYGVTQGLVRLKVLFMQNS